MNAGTWKLGDESIDDQPTFLAHALAMSLRYGPGPWPRDAYQLPDDPPPPADGGPVMTSVVLDGIRTHHFGPGEDAAAVTAIADRLEALVEAAPSHESVVKLHRQLSGPDALSVVDDLLEELRRRKLPRDRLRLIGRHLAEHGSHRNTTKIGIALIGACGDERDRDLLMLLGTLEEFTLYAVVALLRTQRDRQRAVYELARRVEDWGRIHAVERLKGCDDPEIKGWLLREGFRNGVMNEYLAHIAATSGDLYSALLDSEVDEALLDGAGGILAALAVGGPAEDMTDYPEAVPCLGRYADLIDVREANLDRLSAVLTITGFLRDSDDGLNWADGDLVRLRDRYERILSQPRWAELVLALLADPSGEDFTSALWAASRLQLPMVPQILTRLQVEPLDAYAWDVVIRHASPDQARQVTALAERLLPLEELANGPGEHFGFGSDAAADQALESIVGGLDAFPGVGLPLIRVALVNRVTRIRRAALGALTAWGRQAVPDRAVEWVRAASAVEPHKETREEMIAFLSSRDR
ncbi:hypothetical protein [Microbispora sp. GKU 823]|uniref:hypothetical protein n=1 Tax=Microbispora sp. GKU 823 TaxID=1652100 RepID=UPI0009A2F4B8|nr:hypothetical protein [Microbispora sp. GKU 823]